jgi:hypothetical protein
MHSLALLQSGEDWNDPFDPLFPKYPGEPSVLDASRAVRRQPAHSFCQSRQQFSAERSIGRCMGFWQASGRQSGLAKKKWSACRFRRLSFDG